MPQTGTSEQADRSRLDRVIDELGQRGDRALVQAWTPKGAEEWSYRSAGQQVRALAQGLRERVGAGETVALIGQDRPEWILAALAIIRCGAVVTPLDVQLADDTLGQVLRDSGARLIFTTSAQQERVRKAAPEAQVLLLDTDDDRGWRSVLVDDERSHLPENRPEASAALFYTSGTTGPPKGVPLSHRNLAFQLETLAEAGVVQDRDRILLPLPLHHVYPFVVGMLVPISLGLTLILPQSLTGAQVLRAVREGEATVIIGVPRLYEALLHGIVARTESAGRTAAALFHAMLKLSRGLQRRLGLRAGKWLLRPLHRQVGPQLRVLASGGGALDEELGWNLEALGWQVAIGYGLTETAPLLTLDPPGRARLNTVGRPVRGVDIRIDREAAPEGRARSGEGEILARGPNVFAGYRHQPEKTREAFTEDGWFRTGDLGHLDDDGYLHVTGRVSTVLVTKGGENIQPDDLEARYQRHPAIREIGVLQREGRLVGLVVPSPEIADDVASQVRDAIAEVSRSLPSYQRLSDFALTRKPLPRTRLGKIKRHLLDQRYQRAREQGGEAEQAAPIKPQDMSAEDRALLEQPAARAAWDWLAERYPKQGLTPDTRLQLDLGVDSLEWLNMTMEVAQRSGAELSDEAIGRIETVRDLLTESVEAAEQGAGGVDPLEDPEQVLDERQKRWLSPRGRLLELLAYGLYGLVWALVHGLFRLQVSERERLPKTRPIVLACNHLSHLDPLVVAAALPFRQLRTLYWAGWTGVVFTNPVTRSVSRIAQVIPIDPRTGVRSSMALAAAVLRHNRGLIWFPEGERSKSGELQAFRPGIGMLLERYRVPVVLVSIRGTYEAMPPGRRIPALRTLSVRFGEVLDPGRLAEEGEGKSEADRIVDAMRKQMVKLQSEH